MVKKLLICHLALSIIKRFFLALSCVDIQKLHQLIWQTTVSLTASVFISTHSQQQLHYEQHVLLIPNTVTSSLILLNRILFEDFTQFLEKEMKQSFKTSKHLLLQHLIHCATAQASHIICNGDKKEIMVSTEQFQWSLVPITTRTTRVTAATVGCRSTTWSVFMPQQTESLSLWKTQTASRETS